MSGLKVRARQAVGRAMSWIAGDAPQPDTLTVLMYHAVTGERIEDTGQMSVPADQFDGQLAEVVAAGIPVVDLEEGVECLGRGALERGAVAIVFDDGFVGVHDHAAPALQARSLPATVFVTTSWIDRAEMPLAEARLGRPMTWSEVRSLAQAGITIGNHTETHPRLATLGEEAVRREVARARDTIADRVGRPPATFAYPFGSFDTFDVRTREALAEEGVRVACTTVSGRNRRGDDPLALKRIRVSWCDGGGEIRRAAAGCYDWYRWVQRAQSARAVRLPAR